MLKGIRMTIVSSDLEAKIRSAPNDKFDLIVKTQDDATTYLDWFTAQGIKVTRQFRLSPGVAVTCSGVKAQALLAQNWIVSVELDQPVSAF
jgi:hypothetical protein